MLLPEVKQGACQVAGGRVFAGLGPFRMLPVTRWMHPMEAGVGCFGAGVSVIRKCDVVAICLCRG